MRSGVIEERGECDTTEFRYVPDFLGAEAASSLLNRLWSELPWRQERIVLFGRRIPQPRLSAWLGDPDARYRYSGLMLEPAPWHPDLQELGKTLESATRKAFNSVLVNAYRNGRDSMGWHADDEPELGTRPVVASVSLGACRRFLVKPRHGGPARVFHLEHGSLLLMGGDSQSRYRHSLPKTARPTDLRINLTFRYVNSQA